MLPEAEFVFLDELFNANSAILNNLLTVLNERIYRRGAETHQLPLLSSFAASNHLPRTRRCGPVRPILDPLPRGQPHRDEMPRLLAAGWELERAGPAGVVGLGGRTRAWPARSIGWSWRGIVEAIRRVVSKVRDLGVVLTDRRAVKVLKLVAASAVLCGRSAARISDFWVLRYVWDREEQVAPLASLVAGTIAACRTSPMFIRWPPSPIAWTPRSSPAG